jgi:hypothetical protein
MSRELGLGLWDGSIDVARQILLPLPERNGVGPVDLDQCPYIISGLLARK